MRDLKSVTSFQRMSELLMSLFYNIVGVEHGE